MNATSVAPENGYSSPRSASLLSTLSPEPDWLLAGLAILLGLLLLGLLLGLRYVGPGRVAFVQRRWLAGEAGFLPEALSPGFHLGLWCWRYRLYRVKPVQIEAGKIGYVYARIGSPLPAGQTLGRVVCCNHFQNVCAFLEGGQRGRQRAVLREGSYAVNLVLFSVLTEEGIHAQAVLCQLEMQKLEHWHRELKRINGFAPVVVQAQTTPEGPLSHIGIVTVHEGPSMPPGERLAAEVAGPESYQDAEVFLQAGGCRGLQAGVLGEGVYFINRWFATVELRPGERVRV